MRIGYLRSFLILGVVGTSFLFAASGVGASESDYSPSRENLEARQWFQDAKFGLFVHWRVYSVLADGEWVMQIKQIPAAT